MDGSDGPSRLSAEERAKRRDQLSRASGDRYQNLLHALRGGRAAVPGARGSIRFDWHPIAGTLVRGAIVVLCLYLVVTAGIRFVREREVSTWAGPTADVTSGQRLEGCPAVTGYDDTFPRWIRFEGRVFLATDSVRPVGFDPGPSYPDTGYSLGDLRLHRIMTTPDGREGRSIVIRLAAVPSGKLFVLTEECR